MIIEYEQNYLQELYQEGKCRDKKHYFQPQVVKKYQNRIDTLITTTCKEDLFVFHSLHFEALHGDKAGLYSIRVDNQYRIEFSIKELGTKASITIARIFKLSNHYK